MLAGTSTFSPVSRKAATTRSNRSVRWSSSSPNQVAPKRVQAAWPGSRSVAPTMQAAPSTACGPKASINCSSLSTPFCREATIAGRRWATSARAVSVSLVLTVTSSRSAWRTDAASAVARRRGPAGTVNSS